MNDGTIDSGITEVDVAKVCNTYGNHTHEIHNSYIPVK